MEGYILESISEKRIEDFKTLQELLCKYDIKSLRIIKNVECCDYSVKFKAEVKNLEDREASSLRYQNQKVNEQILYCKQDLNKFYMKNTKLEDEVERLNKVVKLTNEKNSDLKKTIDKQKNKIDDLKKEIEYIQKLKEAGY